jgi:sortase A
MAAPQTATAPPTGSLATGGLPTRLVASAAGIEAPIAEVGSGKFAWETAWRAVGHNLDSSLPGQPGNMVLTGHVSVADKNNAAYFAKLDKLAPGDVVDVYSGGAVFHYTVSIVPPTAVNVLRSGAGATLTLITALMT